MRRLLLVSTAILLNVATAMAVDAPFWKRIDDPSLQLIKERLYTYFLNEAEVNHDSVKILADSMMGNGKWKDITYGYRDEEFKFDPKPEQREGDWKAAEHLSRLVRLARAFQTPNGKRYHDNDLRKAFINGLDHWLDADYRSFNHWNYTVGVPMQMAKIALLMEDEISYRQKFKLIEILYRSVTHGATGRNLADQVLVTTVRACIQPNLVAAGHALELIYFEVTTDKEEGIQPDFSFYQHGNVLYSGAYGAGFSTEISMFMKLTTGTSIAFTEDKVDIITRYILDGQRWMIRGSRADYGVLGRTITRKNAGYGDGRFIMKACENMAALKTNRQAEFEALAAQIKTGKSPADKAVVGNKYFFSSDFMTHHRENYYASVRMYSKRIWNTDFLINNESLLSHHIADGTTFVLMSGNEYQDIFGVWDWNRVPGTTVEQKPPLTDNAQRAGETEFVGGVSDGMYGMAAFDFKYDSLSAKKAYFLFDKGFVCLGAGINCATSNTVLTSLNQCLLSGQIKAGIHGKEILLKKGLHPLKQVSWVHHDNVGYICPEPAAITVKNEIQSGDWFRIDHRYSKDKDSLPVFSLWVDHGKKPADAKYQYIVCPGMALSEVKTFAKKAPFNIIKNEKNLQAVFENENNILGAAFYEPGKLDVAGHYTLSVDQPCLVLCRKGKNGIEVSVSDPVRKGLKVNVRVNDEELVFDLPGGRNEGGKSATKAMRITR